MVQKEHLTMLFIKSGWTEDYAFEAWFKNVFLKYVASIPKPIVVFFNGHGSNITFDTPHKKIKCV